jgi:hypothetical protein
MPDQQFLDALKVFVDGLQEATERHYTEHLKNLPVPEITVGSIGQKMAKIVQRNDPLQSKGGNVVAFVAVCDNATKALGFVQRGDIMKPASWQSPALHARGNIFSPTQGKESYNSQSGSPSINYMR